MSNDRKITITLSELRRMKQEAFSKAVEQVSAKYADIIQKTAEDDMYMLLLTTLTAMREMGFSEEDASELADRIADIQIDINNGKRDTKKMEKQILKTYGFRLRKEQV